ncbi:dihydrofolate reductase family protein [Companilactobacillus sp. DQM5]|uniref:dihydrofolate reductase family protein n=1 Tax=Companilactobacillus sp. DQM5 TaxID=3463359 RepID=UPI0040587957
MRKVVFYGAVTLDGFLSDNSDDLSWLFESNLNGKSTYEEFEKNVDTFVMGKTTFEETQNYLNTKELYPGKEKIVFTHDLTMKYNNTKFVSENPATIIKQLAKKEGKWIWVIGGGSIIKPLLEENLIDELWIQIVPVLLGHGKRLFEEGSYRQRFKLKEVTPLGELTELHLIK